jgi:hypothetical protein
MFGPKTDEVTGEWRRLHKEELYALYSSLNILRAIKSRRMRWTGHVARTGAGEVHKGIRWEDMIERDHLEDINVDRRIILKWIFKKWDGKAWTRMIWLRIGTGGGHL